VGIQGASAYQTYLETEILTAEPVRLVQMLYRGALDAIDDARAYLKSGDIAGRSRAISKAMEIVQELSAALTFEAGVELSRNLAELYDYSQRRLLDANIRQADEPLAEVQRLMAELLDAWNACIPELVNA
jgi:flagellar protein FliS